MKTILKNETTNKYITNPVIIKNLKNVKDDEFVLTIKNTDYLLPKVLSGCTITEFYLPTSWHECTLSQAIKVQDYELVEDEFKVLALIAGYSNIELQDLKRMTLAEIKQLTDAMKFVLDPLPEEPIADFNWKGKHYYTIESFLTQESQDYFTTESILQAHQHNTYKALPELLAVMCKQEGESLDDFNLVERAKEFEDLPMSIACGIRVFFYALGMLYQLNSQSFSNRDKIIQAKADEVEITLKKLAGGDLSSRLVARMLRKSMKSLLKSWKTYSFGIQSNSKE